MAEQLGLSFGGSGKASSAASGSMKPLPMKLFSTWEVDKSTPSCIPRLCSLTLTRLVVFKPLENDLQSVIIAIKMQSSKRVLRSNEITILSNGLLDTELDLSFSLQYPHFLKRDGNRLQIMLQRRKKYKNRTILGYKTLAAGHINMSQVLQRPADQEMNLYADGKERSVVLAKVMMLSLCSQPVDHDERRLVASVDVDRSPGEMSDEDELADDQEFSSNEDTSDVEPLQGEDDHPARSRKGRSAGAMFSSRQRNLKQRFVALLRRFKVTDEVLESAVQDLGDQDSTTRYPDDMFEDVENLSDSDLDIDTISIHSTAKPKLRPFFAGRGGSGTNLDASRSPNLDDRCTDENNGRRNDSDCTQPLVHDATNYRKDSVLPSSQEENPVHSIPPSVAINVGKSKQAKASPKLKQYSRNRSNSFGEGRLHPMDLSKRRCSTSNVESTPRRILLEQMSAMLSADNSLPDCIVMVNNQEWQGQLLAQALQSAKHRTVCTYSTVDVKAVLSAIMNKIQKYSNNKNTSLTLPMKVAIVGGDSYISSVLRPYVELFSAKSPDWLNFIRFLIVPFGTSVIAKNISQLDAKYGSLFNDGTWKDNIFEKSDISNRFSQSMDMGEVASRIVRYFTGANHLVNFPLAEAILTNKDKGIDDSSQLIVPFIGEVRLGPMDLSNSSLLSAVLDLDDSASQPANLSNSPPQSTHMISDKVKDAPSSNQTITTSHVLTILSSPDAICAPQVESFDLQVDYWLVPPKVDPSEKMDKTAKKDLKCSLKTMFRSMQIFRPLLPSSSMPLGGGSLPPGGGSGEGVASSGLSMIVVTREKKQKIMRIGKKSKDSDASKSQQIDSISRLICTSKSQSHPLNVTIDGVDWTGVKFFQVSGQWQTHVKQFPVLLFGCSNDVVT